VVLLFRKSSRPQAIHPLSGTAGVPPPDGHPSSSHGVAHPLIRPSTPFGQTSTHRSRKPTPLPLPSFLSRLLFLCPLCPSFSHPPPSYRSFHPRPRPTTLDPTHPHPRPFKLARIPRMHQLFLIVCLTRTHATAGIRARITHTHARARVRTYIQVYLQAYTDERA